MCLNHPETTPYPNQWKIVLPKTIPWCLQGWGPLPYKGQGIVALPALWLIVFGATDSPEILKGFQ